MPHLAIDTTGSNCSVALRVAGAEDVCRTEVIGRGHAEHLAPMVQQILAEGDIQPKQLTRVTVTVGPGSFAGSRVGVAFARGLALATGAQAVGVNNLTVLAAQVGPGAPLAVIHDAKRGELVVQVWRDGVDGELDRVSIDQAPAHILENLGPVGVLTGSGSKFVDLAGYSDADQTELDMHVVLDLGQNAEPIPPSPFYARPPDAKLPGGISV
jgi:tRNA threonylcarbamoyladenosine biosynthesis protein TsaB